MARLARFMVALAAMLFWLAGCAGSSSPPPRREQPAPQEPAASGPRLDRWGWAPAPEERWRPEPLPVSAPRVAPSDAAPLDVRAQGGRVELHVEGQVQELSVAPDGRLWLTTDEGRSYRSDGIGQPFRPGSLVATCDGPEVNIDRISFFTPEKAIATGYLGRGHDEYFRTEDGGETWERRRFGQDGVWDGQWIYDVFVTPGGEAWMGGSRGQLWYSRDYGLTWTQKTAPYDDHDRVYRIFMGPSGSGVVAALGNGLKTTHDGGRTWTQLETPRDQGLAPDPDPETVADDSIENVGLFGPWLIASQNGKVFARHSKGTRWQPIAGGTLTCFEVDREGRRLLGINTDLRVVAIDEALEATSLGRVTLKAPPMHVSVQGESLYVLDEALNQTEITAGGARSSAPLSEAGDLHALEKVRRLGGSLWGITAFHLYRSDDAGRSWQREADSAERLLGLVASGPDTLLVWTTDVVRTFDTRTRAFEPVPSLAGARISGIVAGGPGRPWIAYGGSPELGEVHLSSDGGASWALIDRWTDRPIRDAVVLEGGDVILWSYWNDFRRLLLSGSRRAEELRAPGVSGLDVDFPCCTSLYFIDGRSGYLRGYVHHRGDHVFSTADGGASWESAESEAFPFAQVVPFRGGALAVRGSSFSYEETNRRELVLLEGRVKRTIFRAEHAISDVSVGLDGRVLVEVDPDPETYDDSAGREWFELAPP